MKRDRTYAVLALDLSRITADEPRQDVADILDVLEEEVEPLYVDVNGTSYRVKVLTSGVNVAAARTSAMLRGTCGSWEKYYK